MAPMGIQIRVGHILKLFKLPVISINSVPQNSICTSSTRHAKHWNQKFRKLRSQKVIKVDLPNYEESMRPMNELSKEEVRSRMKERGVSPVSNKMDRPFFISTTGDIFEPYVPPEGDGKVSFITKEGAKQKLDFVGKKGKSMMSIRKLRKFDDDFEVDEFLILAQELYLKAHNAMMNVRKDKEELLLYVTEKAYPEMLHNAIDKTINWQMIGLLEQPRLVQARTTDVLYKENLFCQLTVRFHTQQEMLHNAIDKTINWQMIGLLEQPRLVQARTTDVLYKENLFCQLTVRFHTQQKLAVYDRFGRLMYGSEILAKDVLEYIVYEKHLSNKHSAWRIHAKIIPDWMPAKDSVPKTYRVQEEPLTSTSDTDGSQSQVLQQPPRDTPALATA